MTTSDMWTRETAETYDADEAEMFDPDVLGPTLDVLQRLADGGPVLELAVGTGRVAIPLAERGLSVGGIELSAPMVEVLHRKRTDLPVTIGDMATATAPSSVAAPGSFALVYLVFNTLGNLRTQDEQVACFLNAARHLAPGGRFVIEQFVPHLRRFPPGQAAVPFSVSEAHTGFDVYDQATQEGTSHHFTRGDDGTYRYGVHHFRYVWPAETDLMARLAGLEPESRHADWAGTPFGGDSGSHVSVWRKPA